MNDERKLNAIRKEHIYKAHPDYSRNKFNASIKEDEPNYDYSSADNYLESKRAAGWFRKV